MIGDLLMLFLMRLMVLIPMSFQIYIIAETIKHKIFFAKHGKLKPLFEAKVGHLPSILSVHP